MVDRKKMVILEWKWWMREEDQNPWKCRNMESSESSNPLDFHHYCWQIGGLAESINSTYVRHGHLGECTIRLGYAPFLTTIAFRRVGSTWGPTSGIRAMFMGLNPRDVARREDCWQIGRLAISINSPCVHHGRLGECTIRVRYAPFLTAIAFRKVGSAWGPTPIFGSPLSCIFIRLFCESSKMGIV